MLQLRSITSVSVPLITILAVIDSKLSSESPKIRATQEFRSSLRFFLS
jgi:hypothetical protein